MGMAAPPQHPAPPPPPPPSEAARGNVGRSKAAALPAPVGQGWRERDWQAQSYGNTQKPPPAEAPWEGSRPKARAAAGEKVVPEFNASSRHPASRSRSPHDPRRLARCPDDPRLPRAHSPRRSPRRHRSPPRRGPSPRRGSSPPAGEEVPEFLLRTHGTFAHPTATPRRH